MLGCKKAELETKQRMIVTLHSWKAALYYKAYKEQISSTVSFIRNRAEDTLAEYNRLKLEAHCLIKNQSIPQVYSKLK